MSIPLIICDDSAMSRKMVKRALPTEWDVDITFCKNGQECLDAILAGQGEIVFLDLTMPVMDGFTVLEMIKKHDLKAIVIVISADIQPEAIKRVTQLGALSFIKKPIDTRKLMVVLNEYGLL